ncbi:nostrin isoform X2 [Poecilia formosa]|uniref:Osteoclast-stimulating factor 1 n=1 Tax=Poecilia formosa TaxID=48698 RepID=A0A087YF07_POEFO|nr:PREDICTED: nostrin isoform X2 [Poecilia formosa]
MSGSVRRMVKVPGSKLMNCRGLKMKDPIDSCSYNHLYQNLKQYSKNGDNYLKELQTVFQQRAELELTYSKGLAKLAGKLIKACQGMPKNSTYTAWCQVSNEMYSRADAHRTLGNAFQQEATEEIRQVLDEHAKRKRPLDTAIERSGKLFTANWNEQLKLKKRLHGLTKEHEALFNYLENNKHISTEKEKQKMCNRLTKSAEQQSIVDEHYYSVNMEGHQMRLKLQNTLKNCCQVTQELEKNRIEVLCNLLSKYNLHMSTFSQTLKHGQKQIEQTAQRVDVDKDIQTLMEESDNTNEDNKIEFLMADYFEEDSKSLMTKDRRKDAIKLKLQRLEENITKTKKECEGIEKLIKTYTECSSFSNQKNLEETEELRDENTLKLDLLEATHYKLSLCLSEFEEAPKTSERFGSSIFKWKDKDCEHSIVQLSRPVKLRKTPLRSQQSLRASIIYKGPIQVPTEPTEKPEPNTADQITSTTPTQETAECSGSTGNEALPTRDDDKAEDQTAAVLCSIGKCKALYDFTPEHVDELTFKEGDVLDIYKKEENGWWIGALNERKGHFPSSYVEELPQHSHSGIKSSDA